MNKNYKPGLMRDVDKELVEKLNDEEKIKLTIDGYDRVSDDWDKTRQNFWPELISEVVKHIKPNTKILDLGCGNGRLIPEIEKLSSNNYNLVYIGVDPSKELIKIAEEKYKNLLMSQNKEDGNNKYELGVFNGMTLNNVENKENINLKDEDFDQVISIAVLHHIPPAKVVNWLREASRVVKDGSINIFTTWNLSESNYDLNENNDAVIGFVHHKNTRYVHHYNYEEIKNIFKEAGLKILDIKEIKRDSGMSNTFILSQKLL